MMRPSWEPLLGRVSFVALRPELFLDYALRYDIPQSQSTVCNRHSCSSISGGDRCGVDINTDGNCRD